jgi:hypothetical protein
MAGNDRASAAVVAFFASPPTVAAHPAVRDLRRIARDVLAPHAAAADDPAVASTPPTSRCSPTPASWP